MSVFNPEDQNKHLDNKIVAGLERLSQVFRTLLWEQAKAKQLSPIQIQLLIFIRYHGPGQNNVSYLAREFSVTKPTISDAIKVLGQKGLIRRMDDSMDNRRYSIALTAAGKKVVASTEDFTMPFTQWVAQTGEEEKKILWESITGLIRSLNGAGWISVQRNCYSCKHYMQKGGEHFCKLINEVLQVQDIRIDCPEHVSQH
jgi:DNA-binding MarR family transcriptional regulator